jgi:hypothetical protein
MARAPINAIKAIRKSRGKAKKPKICIDCKFYRQIENGVKLCVRPTYSYVTGIESPLNAGCSEEREAGKCGPSAKYYEVYKRS